MRKEITESIHWRKATASSNSWSTQRRNKLRQPLPAEAVDAAFDTEDELQETSENFQDTDILSTLANQLTLLDAQREQIQKLLAQAQGK